MNETWVRTAVEASPILTDELVWEQDMRLRRHPIRVTQHIDRDAVFTDLFAKAAAMGMTLRLA